MKRVNFKLLLLGICMLAAGICYSCSRNQESQDLSDNAGMVLSTVETVLTETSQSVSSPVYHYVHICGEVNAPGVYEMEEGSRVFQAIEKAGGFTELAAAEYLNMADMVKDGMKLVVPGIDEIGAKDQFGGELAKEESDGKVNLNTATKEQLMTLRGIGEAKAEDILRFREEKGLFQSIEDIKKISGIKDAAFQKIKDDITV